MLHSIARLELGTDKTCFTAPNDTVTLGATYQILLMIHTAEKRVASNSRAKDQGGREPRELKRMTCEILYLQRVHGWKPCGRAPGKIEAKVIMANVNGANVPILIDEKVDDIHGM